MTNFFSAVALENLNNLSLAVKTDQGVRKIKNLEDMESHLVVFVSNCVPVDETDLVIAKGRMARCRKVNI